MLLKFAKMQALGNDFVVIDAVSQTVDLSPDVCKRLADRRLGIGCDQILVVDPAPHAEVDFAYRIFNADGSQVGQCGNGARCFARFVQREGLSDKTSIKVATATTQMQLDLLPADWVRVHLQVPDFSPAKIPLLQDVEQAEYELPIAGGVARGGAVSVGNPHFVIEVDDVDAAPVDAWGAQLATHPMFPEGVNVGFVQRLTSNHLRLRVYERGVGETPACGSGACAAAVVMRRWGKTDSKMTVQLPGGDLRVQWDEAQAILLEGPADWVYSGEIQI